MDKKVFKIKARIFVIKAEIDDLIKGGVFIPYLSKQENRDKLQQLTLELKALDEELSVLKVENIIHLMNSYKKMIGEEFHCDSIEDLESFIDNLNKSVKTKWSVEDRDEAIEALISEGFVDCERYYESIIRDNDRLNKKNLIFGYCPSEFGLKVDLSKCSDKDSNSCEKCWSRWVIKVDK